jgi:hypothetical protein
MKMMTSAQAAKELKRLNEERDALLSAEARASVFTAAIQEDIESARPDYDYEATFDDLRAIEMKIIRLKHSISRFNLTTKVPGFGMTIDEMLVYIPQQTALKKKLDKMRSRLPKERINSLFSLTSNFIEYNYCNYDVKKVQSDFEEASKRLAEAQMALDRINTTVEFEADI